MNQSSDHILKNEYVSRLNRTIDYIYSHSHEELNLAKLSEVACFSKYHFHRIFRAILGETVNEFVQRIRLEKAFGQLMLHKFKSITDIAFDCGFSSSQNFARSFKAQYGTTPSQARAEYNWESWLEKMRQIRGQDISELQADEMAFANHYILQLKLSLERRLTRSPEMQVLVKKLPSYRVAYVRILGPYRIETGIAAFTRLLQWANPRGYVNDNAIAVGVAWNNPYFTPPEKLIYDACITVPESTTADRWVNIQLLQGGEFAVYHCEIDLHRQEEEWLRFLLYWLAKSDYQPDDRPAYSIYYSSAEESFPTKQVRMDLCLPVKSLMR
jgi:AraC family transcriptional regulator